MKRIFKIVSAALVIGICSFSIVLGQEKKSEQKIKVVIADGSDTKVLIDTVFTDDMIRDSIKLKDGTFMFIGKHGDHDDFLSKDGSDHFFVTVSSDSKDNKKEITIVKSDSLSWTAERKPGKIYIYSNSESAEGKAFNGDKMMTWSINDEDGPGRKVVIIKDGKTIDEEGEESYTYTIRSGNSVRVDSDAESTKYVIRKDGMVISVEGQDYAKVKKLADEIGAKIDSSSEATDRKAVKKK